MTKRAAKSVRNEQLNVRVTPEELAAIEAAARRLGQPIAWWVRRVLLAAAVSK